MAIDVLQKIKVPVPADLFPLALTTFEKYMVSDDCPDYPMGFVIEITLSGQLDRERFESALDLATRRHPLLLATISTSSHRLLWQYSNQVPTVQWYEEPDTDDSVATGYINLRNMPGLKTVVWHETEKSRVSFLFHHAVVDGIGAMHFIGDLLAIYGQSTCALDDRQPELSTVISSTLHQRGELYPKDSQLDHSWLRTLRHLYEFMRYYPSGIASTNSEPYVSESKSRRPFLTRVLDRSQLTTIKNEAARLNVAPNDIYIANLFRTIKEWNQLHGRKIRKECYRIGIPASLRTPTHDNSPAANVLGFVFLNQPGKTIQDRDGLVQDIHKRTSQILSSTDSRLFSNFIKVGFSIPMLMSSLLKLPLRFSTATLANVGDVKRQLNSRFPLHKRKCIAGSVALEGLFGAAPIRKGTSVGLSLGTYTGRLLMNFNCDPTCFSRAESEQFADLFVSNLLDHNQQLEDK
ncbi:MAG TPA: hypothetical protein DIT97_13975 [Gimesia maris]|uniref:Condensation domain-containing protein n=1 Tax=Gimesia maris TaxID=122 RepID=A0A3D3R5F4_9PLAN|nr:hypothetical protein [Gimesia maris]